MRRMKSTYEDLMAELAATRKYAEYLEAVIARMFPTAAGNTRTDGTAVPPTSQQDDSTRAGRVLAIMKKAPGEPMTLLAVAHELREQQHRADADKDIEFLRRKAGRILGADPHRYKRVGRGEYAYQEP